MNLKDIQGYNSVHIGKQIPWGRGRKLSSKVGDKCPLPIETLVYLERGSATL